MNSKNRQQKWIENHPVAWWIMNKIGDFLWFIGTYVDVDGNETRSDRAMIIYSKTGTHIYPIRKENDDET